jgi:hypothetical protein
MSSFADAEGAARVPEKPTRCPSVRVASTAELLLVLGLARLRSISVGPFQDSDRNGSLVVA